VFKCFAYRDKKVVGGVFDAFCAPLHLSLKGGGSLTALPIIETQAGDICLYPNERNPRLQTVRFS
jgi:hypothetical protein